MDTFKLHFMASEHMVYEGDAESVSLMTTEGSIGILAHHSNLVMAVVPGEVEYVPAGEAAREAGLSGKQTVVVSDGLLKVENNEVMLLVDTAEKPEEIDEARARRAEEQAREALKRANSNRDAALASAELSRAVSRIKASKNKHSL
ncbi:MAG: ATP synthase F1 subunit epsilon [Mogibacterium sp.]|nr:ATP synthase F1 subunit epsilon [Mogibacterium sp.]